MRYALRLEKKISLTQFIYENYFGSQSKELIYFFY
jgi:hypothetical protein